jgi:MFS family permease
MSCSPETRPNGETGISAVFQNRSFRLLWASQIFGQSAQNAILFVQTVMVEGLTRSSGMVGVMVVMYYLPAILFGLLSGMVIDRYRKKSILLFCNVSRVFVVASFIFLHRYTQGAALLSGVYALSFVLSTIGQLSDPAEAATVPLRVPRHLLLTANSVFHLLFNVAQVLGLLFVAPVSVKLAGVDGGFAIISLCYLITSVLIWFTPVDEPQPLRHVAENILPELWEELKAGWGFIAGRKSVLIAICQYALVTMLTMVLATLAPGFATRVLHMQPADAVYIFFSAGVGMFMVTLWTSQAGHRFRRESITAVGLLITTVAFVGFAFITWSGETASGIAAAPPALVIAQVVVMALLLGAGMTLAVVPAQTIVLERSPQDLRGRVIAAQFLFINFVGMVPMLVISRLADLIGIPKIMFGLSILTLVSAVLSFRARRSLRED